MYVMLPPIRCTRYIYSSDAAANCDPDVRDAILKLGITLDMQKLHHDAPSTVPAAAMMAVEVRRSAPAVMEPLNREAFRIGISESSTPSFSIGIAADWDMRSLLDDSVATSNSNDQGGSILSIDGDDQRGSTDGDDELQNSLDLSLALADCLALTEKKLAKVGGNPWLALLSLTSIISLPVRSLYRDLFYPNALLVTIPTKHVTICSLFFSSQENANLRARLNVLDKCFLALDEHLKHLLLDRVSFSKQVLGTKQAHLPCVSYPIS